MEHEKITLAKMLLVQLMLDNPIIILHHLYHLATTQAVIAIIGLLVWCQNEFRQNKGQIIREIWLEGDWVRNELMSHLLSSDLCHNMIRMSS